MMSAHILHNVHFQCIIIAKNEELSDNNNKLLITKVFVQTKTYLVPKLHRKVRSIIAALIDY